MEQDNITPVDLQRYLGGIDYPVNKDALVNYAEEKGADEAVLSFMRRLPDREFRSPADLSQAAGELMNG